MRTAEKLFYVAHPLGVESRPINIVRAKIWFRWLLDEYPQHAFVMPWLPYCDVLPETPECRARGIRDDITALRRCDGIALVGPQLSRGMEAELVIARELYFEIIDHVGSELPL